MMIDEVYQLDFLNIDQKQLAYIISRPVSLWLHHLEAQ